MEIVFTSLICQCLASWFLVIDFGLGKRNQRRCTLSYKRRFSTVLSVEGVNLTDILSFAPTFGMGHSLAKSLHLFSVLVFCTRLRIFTLNLRVRLSSHLLHSELTQRQIKSAQGPVSGTYKGTATCKSYFGKPLWYFGVYLLGCTHSMVLTP